MPTPANGPAQPFTPPEGYVFKDDSAPAQSAFQADRGAMGPVAAVMANPARPIPQNRAQAMGMLQSNLPKDYRTTALRASTPYYGELYRDIRTGELLNEPGGGTFDQNEGVPEYARQVVDMNAIHERTMTDPSEIKEDRGLYDSDEISIRTNPATGLIKGENGYTESRYTPSVRAHELSHYAQKRRRDGVQPGADISYVSGDDAAYGYGFQPGLERRIANHQGMESLNVEQQGDIVGNYYLAMKQFQKKVALGLATRQDYADFYRTTDVYNHFFKQLAPQPVDNRIDTGRDIKPPGLPSPEVAGVPYVVPSTYISKTAIPVR